MSGRPSWDEYFLGVAKAVSERADCTRRKVGAVLVRDLRIVSTGYNGARSGDPGCASEGACPRGQLTHEELEGYAPYSGAGSCIAVHAEVNALKQNWPWLPMDIGTLYVTDEPCVHCWDYIKTRGRTAARVVWPEGEWTR